MFLKPFLPDPLVNSTQMRVLLVEDEPAVRDAVERALRGAGHKADLAREGPAGLDLAMSNPYDAVVLDLDAMECHRGERMIPLTRTEYSLLELFMANPRKVLPRDVIFDRVWGYDFGPDSNSLDVYVGYLRRKLETGGDA